MPHSKENAHMNSKQLFAFSLLINIFFISTISCSENLFDSKKSLSPKINTGNTLFIKKESVRPGTTDFHVIIGDFVNGKSNMILTSQGYMTRITKSEQGLNILTTVQLRLDADVIQSLNELRLQVLSNKKNRIKQL